MKAAKLASRGFPSETKIYINEIPTLLEAYICPANNKLFIHLQDAKLKERSTWDTVTHQILKQIGNFCVAYLPIAILLYTTTRARNQSKQEVQVMIQAI